MKTSFVAFAQNHTDASALEAVRTQIETMHSKLANQGRSLVIALERSPEDVLTDPKKIAELHNQGVMQAYFDDMRKAGETPSLVDFHNKHGRELRWDSESLTKIDPKSLMNKGESWEELSEMSQRNIKLECERQEGNKLSKFYTSRSFVSQHANNLDKGQSRIQEAAIYDFASKNGVKIVGLDPLTDEQKASRLLLNSKDIDSKALEDMEYERVQGMATNACRSMKELADDKGGCVVAINMGPAHMGSLDVALNEQINQTPGLDGSKVTMCTCINGPEASSLSTAQGYMKMSVKDMTNAHQRLVGEETRLQRSLDTQTRELQARKFLNHTLTSMEGSDLAEKLKNPAEFAKELCQQSPEVNGLYGSQLEKMMEKAALKLKDSNQDSKTYLCERLGADQNTIKDEQEILDISEQELRDAKHKVAEHQKMLEFANQVDSHVQSMPSTSFVTVSSEKGYGPGIAEVGKQATQLSVMEKLATQGPKLDKPSDLFLGKKQQFEQFQKGDTDQPELQKPGKIQRSEEMQKMKEKFEAFQSDQGESPSRKVQKL